MLPDCDSEYENTLLIAARRHLATYENMAELIRLGAYRRGTDPDVDRAMHITRSSKPSSPSPRRNRQASPKDTSSSPGCSA